MIRVGVPQSVAISISGHKTVSMFMRYTTSDADKIQALKKTAEHLANQPRTQEAGSPSHAALPAKQSAARDSA